MKTILFIILGIILSASLSATNVDTTNIVDKGTQNTVLTSNSVTDDICRIESEIMAKEEMLKTYDNLYSSEPTNSDYLIQMAILEMEIDDLHNELYKVLNN
ncbi:MAG: hypothetical protein JXR68_09340 [Bacteroidales bacterium]|nr:hypothetical protein [Bacteroidales bacterium]